MAVDHLKLQEFLADTPVSDEVAKMAIDTATALVEGYTRGNHVFKSGSPRPGIEAVVLTVSARIAINPGQVARRDTAGPFSTSRSAGFNGFTLAEFAVLNRYRKRVTG